jgi:hypothetical protein
MKHHLDWSSYETAGQDDAYAGIPATGGDFAKAVGTMKSLRKVLRLIPEFEFIEASCCGMAGSFGLEAEHAEIAMHMAELDLLPAWRVAPEATSLANGFSCRHQIREGVDRQPVHIALLLREAMEKESQTC